MQRVKRKKSRIAFYMNRLKTGRCRARGVYHFTHSNRDEALINEIFYYFNSMEKQPVLLERYR